MELRGLGIAYSAFCMPLKHLHHSGSAKLRASPLEIWCTLLVMSDTFTLIMTLIVKNVKMKSENVLQ